VGFPVISVPALVAGTKYSNLEYFNVRHKIIQVAKMNNTPDTNYERKYQQFIKRLRKARKLAQLTQVAAAEKLNKTQSYISKCEKGELRVDVIQLLEFAKLYGKPITYFVDGIE
jgi:ribosome-binding protein aMBF1 (putative translation factor)